MSKPISELIICPHEQGTDEWLNDRAGVVTASQFSTVLSKGRSKNAPSKTRLTLMRKLANEALTGRAVSDGFKTHYMERGNELEDQARAWYELTTGSEVEEAGLVYLNKQRRIGASVDGFVDEDGLHEIKCPAIHTHTEYILGCLAEGEPPKVYYPQIQGQLWVTGREWNDFITFHPEACILGAKLRVYRDEPFIKNLKKEVYQFIRELDEMIGLLRERAA